MPTNFHQIQISDSDFEKAAVEWRMQFLKMPLYACEDVLKYMTGIAGITTPFKLPSVEGSGEFAPFRHDRKSANTTKVDWREIRTYLGNVCEDFVPADIIQTLLGKGTSSLGDGQATAPTARLVIAEVMRSLGNKLHDALFTAKRNASGDTTADLFGGWGTIIDQEITAGTISEANGNLLQLTDAIDGVNAVDIAKEIERSCDPRLRRLDKFLYCDPAFMDAYNDAYLVSHNAVPYNKKYEQAIVEGSGNKTTIIPLDCLAGTDKYILTPRENMIYAFDNMSDLARVEVKRYAPWVVTLAAAMFFGTQLRTVDKRFLKVVKLHKDTDDDLPLLEPDGNAGIAG